MHSKKTRLLADAEITVVSRKFPHYYKLVSIGIGRALKLGYWLNQYAAMISAVDCCSKRMVKTVLKII